MDGILVIMCRRKGEFVQMEVCGVGLRSWSGFQKDEMATCSLAAKGRSFHVGFITIHKSLRLFFAVWRMEKKGTSLPNIFY